MSGVVDFVIDCAGVAALSLSGFYLTLWLFVAAVDKFIKTAGFLDDLMKWKRDHLRKKRNKA